MNEGVTRNTNHIIMPEIDSESSQVNRFVELLLNSATRSALRPWHCSFHGFEVSGSEVKGLGFRVWGLVARGL